MRKMMYGGTVCEVSVADNFEFSAGSDYEYEKDTVAYAVERFFTGSDRFQRECTRESWKLRLAKGKEDRFHRFTYLIPAVLMELPGDWVRLRGRINDTGVYIQKIEIIHF